MRKTDEGRDMRAPLYHWKILIFNSRISPPTLKMKDQKSAFQNPRKWRQMTSDTLKGVEQSFSI